MRWRLTIFVIGTVIFTFGTPLSMAGIEVPPAWRMFHGWRLDTCYVRYLDEDGQTVDRFAAAGYAKHDTAPRRFRHLHDLKSAVRMGRRLCKIYSPLDVELHCGTRDGGWGEAQRARVCR